MNAVTHTHRSSQRGAWMRGALLAAALAGAATLLPAGKAQPATCRCACWSTSPT